MYCIWDFAIKKVFLLCFFADGIIKFSALLFNLYPAVHDGGFTSACWPGEMIGQGISDDAILQLVYIIYILITQQQSIFSSESRLIF